MCSPPKPSLRGQALSSRSLLYNAETMSSLQPGTMQRGLTQQQSAPATQVGLRQRPASRQAPALRPPLRTAKTDEAPTVSAPHRNGTAAPHPANPLDFDELTDIIRMVQDTDIVELELKSSRFSLALQKKEALEVAEPVVIYQQAPQQVSQSYMTPPPQFPAPPPGGVQTAPQGGQAPPAAPAGPPAPAAAPAEDGIVQASPMAGTMYRASAPGEPAFVQEGDVVKKGQTICIIEAMKLMNEIEADTDGTIVKFIAANGTPITIGQALVSIKP